MLYGDENRNHKISCQGDYGPSIRKENVCLATSKMRDGKATGTDKIPIECLKALNETSLEVFTSFYNNIHHTGHIPDDLMQSIFMTVPKNSKSLKAQNAERSA